MTLRLHLSQPLPASVDFLTIWYVLLSPESFKSRPILYTCTTIKFRPEGLFLECPVKESPDYNLIMSQSDFLLSDASPTNISDFKSEHNRMGAKERKYGMYTGE